MSMSGYPILEGFLMLSRRTLFRGGAASAVVLATGAATASPSAAAPLTGRRPDRAALQEALDQLVAAGATAALARVDGPTGDWQGASGVVRLGHPARPTAYGRFRIGSITKTFVSTTVL